MACMKLGSKSEVFRREGQSWVCTSGLPSDVTIEVGDMSFHLHKFPLLSRSGLIEKLIEESCNNEGPIHTLQLDEIPGGAKAFKLIAKFCYGVKVELTALNIVSIRCAAEYLKMSEDCGEGNLIAITEVFLNDVFGHWLDSVKALETCEEVGSYAEELHIVSRCIDSLATKACADPNMFNWPLSENNNNNNNIPKGNNNVMWNGIASDHQTKPQPFDDDWWFEDVSSLSLPFFKRLIRAVELRNMCLEKIAACLIYYAKKYIPLMNNTSQSSLNIEVHNTSSGTTHSPISEAEQKNLVEQVVGLLPNKKKVTSTKCLLRLLRIAMILHTSCSCRDNLEKRIGEQLDEAVLVDLLIPNMGYSVETLYDIDCIQRILDQFMSLHNHESLEQSATTPVTNTDQEGQLMVSYGAANNAILTPLTMVANLVDGYLAEVAPDVNLKLQKFQTLAAVIPDYARPLDDGIYNAIDVYLKAHPWLTDAEREQLCRLMNCQKLSMEASTHAAQNERLPLRVIVQVLFFEQLRLRTSISSWFCVSENLDNSQNAKNIYSSAHMEPGQERVVSVVHDVRERVSELEKECSDMKQEIQKLAKTRKSWSLIPKILVFRRKSKLPSNAKEFISTHERKTTIPSIDHLQKQHHENGKMVIETTKTKLCE